MKIFVVFGSKSDENVYGPLAGMLAKDHEVECEVISAHRNLEQLQEKMSGWQGDAVVAGAGVAAALPGVVAAMAQAPVFGVPVASQFGGIDALASIAQMPPGVPVMTCGPDKTGEIVKFLKAYKAEKAKNFRKIHFVTAQPALAAPEVEKARILGKEKGVEVTSSATRAADAFNVYMVTKAEEVHPDDFCLHLPLFTKDELQKPETYLKVWEWTGRGGLWVGANNTRNAVQSLLRLWRGAEALPEIMYEGSVKNVRGIKGKSPYIFEFSDRYSIFDWGQMPDELDGKGESLAWMGWFFFDFLGRPENWRNWKSPLGETPLLKQLREKGAAHHAIGLVPGHPRCLAVQPVNVIAPQSRKEGGKLVWDYSAYAQKPEGALVPLEVIFRFGVPEGSSLLKRTGDAEYCRALGLAAPPKAGDRFETPVVEFSTKLENGDRYLSYAEARAIAGLSAEEFSDLSGLARLLALRLRDVFAGIGVELWDGKFEFAFTAKGADGRRGFMLVDSIGPDELRLLRDGVHLSKEMLRGHYRSTPWAAGLEKAKALASERGERDWKKICTDELKLVPAPLTKDAKEKVEMVYKGLVRALMEKYAPAQKKEVA